MPSISAAQILSAASANWSSPATWQGGQVPKAGDDVVIRSGDSVYLDVSTPLLHSVRSDGTLDGGKDTLFLRTEISGHVIFDSGCVRYLDSLPLTLGAMAGTYFDLRLDSSGLKLSGNINVQHNFSALFPNTNGITGNGELDVQGSLLYRGASCPNWSGPIRLTGKIDSVRHDTLVRFSAGLNGDRTAQSFRLPHIILAKPDRTYYVRVGYDSASADSLFLAGQSGDTIVDIQSGTLDVPANMIAGLSQTARPFIRIARGAKLRTSAEFPMPGVFDSTHVPLFLCDSGSTFEYYSQALSLIDIDYLYNNLLAHSYDGLELSNVVATCYSNPLNVRRRLELQYGTSLIPAQVARGEQGYDTQVIHIAGDVVNLNRGESGSQGAGLRGCGMVSTGSDKWIFDRGNSSGKDTCNWSGPSMIGSAIIDTNTVLSIRFVSDTACDSLDIVDSLVEKGLPCGGHLIGRVYNEHSPEFSSSHVADSYSGLGLTIISGTDPFLGKTKVVRTSGYPVPGADLLPSSVKRYYNVVPTFGPQNGQRDHIEFQYHCDEVSKANPAALHFWKSIDDGRSWSFSGRSGYDPASLTYTWDTTAVGFPDTSNAFLWTLAGGYRDIPTPVELRSFSVSASGSAVAIDWLTASETALRGFEIIRHSAAGDTTIRSYSTDPNLTSRFPNGGEYRIQDTPTPGLYAYHLIEITENGIRQELSSQTLLVVRAAPWSSLALSLRHVGTTGITGSAGSPLAGQVTFQIYDILGRKSQPEFSIQIVQGDTPFLIPATLVPGVYYLVGIGAGGTATIKFVVREL